MNRLDLQGTWQLCLASPDHAVSGLTAIRPLDRPLSVAVPVPGTAQAALMAAGLIANVYEGFGARAARWVEEAFWLFEREFDLPPSAAGQRHLLVLDGLSLCARVAVNGHVVGEHANVFRPFVADVTARVRAGTNRLAIMLESGVASFAHRDLSAYASCYPRDLSKRQWARRPAFTGEWDWSPRLNLVGILGEAYLLSTPSVWITQAAACPVWEPGQAQATLRVRAWLQNPGPDPRECEVELRVRETGARWVTAGRVAPGAQRLDVQGTIESPQLWWPRGHGAQPLYHAEVAVRDNAGMVWSAVQRFGVRATRLCQDPHPEAGRCFRIEINGRPVFCKGANWITPDLLAPVPPARYEQFLRLALEENINCLRIGGEVGYEAAAFYDFCDEHGILVWQQGAFTCMNYPGDQRAFVSEVEREFRHQVRRLARHPAVALWCGNNEIDWGDADWAKPVDGKYRPDAPLYHGLFPRIVAEEDGTRPYWPSSPGSPDPAAHPQDLLQGDQHYWTIGFGDQDFARYADNPARFASEFGHLGASLPATLRQLAGSAAPGRHTALFRFHDNEMNFTRDPGELLTTRALRLWADPEPESLGLEEYCFLSGVLQGEALAAAIDNWRSRMWDSGGALFWMFADCWPTATSWTTVDWYGRRRGAFWHVQRAFAPVRATLGRRGDAVVIRGLCDDAAGWRGEVEFGVFALAGPLTPLHRDAVTLAPNQAMELGRFPVARLMDAGPADVGGYVLLRGADGTVVSQNRLFQERFRHLQWAKGPIGVTCADGRVRLSSPVYHWAVSLDAGGERPLADNYFDLLPGIPRVIAWDPAWGAPAVCQAASIILRARRHAESRRQP